MRYIYAWSTTKSGNIPEIQDLHIVLMDHSLKLKEE